MPNKEETLQQSRAAYNQWCVQWREQAKVHSKMPMYDLAELRNSGIGKSILCVGNGYTLEENIETIKKHQHSCDIITCDKSLKHLLDNGIMPSYCVVADANVPYKYLEPYKDQVSQVTLLSSVCANPKWTQEANWKKIYFFVNKDILGSENEFCAISGCKNVIPAATNVAGAVVVLLTQCDERGKDNWAGYDKIGLIGYDYCFMPNKPYYAFDARGDGKYNYMRHLIMKTVDGSMAFTSTNLHFSARWLSEYCNVYGLNVVQCTGKTICFMRHTDTLENLMTYKHKTEDKEKVQELVKIRDEKLKAARMLEEEIGKIGKDHQYAFWASL